MFHSHKGQGSYTSMDTLERVALPENVGPRQRSNKFSDIAGSLHSFLDNGANFLPDLHGTDIVQFKPVDVVGGVDDVTGGEKIVPAFGQWNVYNETDLYASVPIEILRNGEVQHLGGAGNMGFTLNVIASNRSRRAFQMCISALVLKCLNGMKSTEQIVSVKAKQTKNLAIPEMLKQGLEIASREYVHFQKDVRLLQQKEVTREALGVCLNSLAANRIVSWSGCGKVYELYCDTSHAEFDDINPSAWRLYNSITNYAKSQPLESQRKIIGGAYWGMSDAGLVDLPASHYSSNYSPLAAQPVIDIQAIEHSNNEVMDIGHIPASV